MQSKDPSFSRKSSEQKLAELALNIGGLSHAEAAQQLLELSNEFRYYSLEAEIAAPFEKAAADLKAKLEAKLKALQEEAAATSAPVVEMPKVEEPTETSTPEPVKAAESATVTEAEPEIVEPVMEVIPTEVEMPAEPVAEEEPAAEKKSLNDRLAGNVLKFGLNDRIGFVKDLFDGSQEDFNRVVSQLNTLGNLNEAMEFIETHISGEYGWDQKEKTAARFIAAVEQKFS
ncbi:MAG: hypothetical protein EBY63_03170 [Flavobacteriia bacterium]|nr:hypothetical protein [Flavobacteriia bacterium]